MIINNAYIKHLGIITKSLDGLLFLSNYDRYKDDELIQYDKFLKKIYNIDFLNTEFKLNYSKNHENYKWIKTKELFSLLTIGKVRAENIKENTFKLLDSANNVAYNKYSYGNVTDIIRLAFYHSFAIIDNHPFGDGNKRASLLVFVLFLSKNNLQKYIISDITFLSKLLIAYSERRLEKIECVNLYKAKIENIII